ncbi:hypothetical protein C2G38_2125427, partial [Gigaspora rosea]
LEFFKLSNKPDGYFVENIAMLLDHVEWDITGTILSSSGDDGKVRLWKSSHNSGWKCMSFISYERQTDNIRCRNSCINFLYKTLPIISHR